MKSRRSVLRSAEALEVRTLLSASTATFKLQTGPANPLSGQDVGTGFTLAIGDITGDGLADVIAGNKDGVFLYYKNTGTATNPAYSLQAGGANPLNGQDVGDYSAPALGDLNGDGLLDLIVGNQDGTFSYFKNTGTATNPAFTFQVGSANPLDGQDIGDFSTPTLGDLNGDGRLDLIAGKQDGMFSCYLNTGTLTVPAFTLQTGTANPLDGEDLGNVSCPTLGDLNGDGRLDLIAGNFDGSFSYYQNIGSATTPAFTRLTGAANPLNGQNVGYLSAPALGDLNGDGRLDLLAQNFDGKFTYYLNVGPYRPTMARQFGSANPLNTADVGFNTKPTIGDLTGDGLPDLIVGSYDGTFFYYKNTGTVGNPAYTLQTGASNPLNGQSFGPRSSPALGDLNGDGLLDLIVGIAGGTVRYFQNTGTATNPAFTMITGFGDPLDGQSTPSSACSPALGDLNGDGLLDLVLGTQPGGFVYYQNTGTSTAPVLSLQSPATNPLNGKDVGKYASPTLGDLNGDGLMDLISGNKLGEFIYYQNTGTATTPAFTEQRDTWNPLNGQVLGIAGNLYSAAALGDLDGDGALDLIAGNVYGNFFYYKNAPAPIVPRLVPKTGSDNPLNGQDVGNAATPTSGDLNGDGLPDLIVGNDVGTFRYYQNTGTANVPAFTLQTGAANPLDGQSVGAYSTPALGDLNGDGLRDLVVGKVNGTFSYYTNTGSTTTPAFTLQSGGADPLNGQDVGSCSAPTLGDLNGDGLLDLIVGNAFGTFSYYKNTGSATTPNFTLQGPATDPLDGLNAGSYAKPSLKDLDGDGLIDLAVGNSIGTFRYYKNTGTRTIPIFTLQGTANPLNGQNFGFYSAPSVGDLDGDGHADLIVGNSDGQFYYYRSQPQNAPVINPATHPQFNLTEDMSSASNTGMSVSLLIASFGSEWYDIDPAPLQGIAVIGTDNTLGNWQYSTDAGANWNNMGNRTAPTALLLAFSTNTRIRFAPNANANGAIPNALTFVGWDQTSGTDTGTANASVRGGNTAFSTAAATINVNIDGVNDAPVLNTNGSPTFPTLVEDPTTNPGMLVSDLIAGMSPLGGITDPDSGALQGLAITAADSTNGSWEYSLNNGGVWTTFPAVGSGSALLLASDVNTRVRFVPNLNFNGDSSITFRAWDQTTGSNGGTGNASINGGTSAFSNSTQESATITITAVNDAPVLNAAGNPTLTPILPNTVDASNPGTTITQIIANMTATGGSITDSDAGAVKGMAISSVDNTHGTWQFTTNNGGTWTDFGSPSTSVARLLAANSTTKIRFRPSAGFAGTATFLFVAWDQTAGTNGGTADITSSGGTQAFSLATDTGSLLVNTAPVLNPTGNPSLASIPEDTFNSVGTSIKDLIASTALGNSYITDVDATDPKGLALYSAPSSGGNWQYSLNNGGIWTTISGISQTNALLLAADDAGNTRLRFVPLTNFNGTRQVYFRAWDQSSGTNGGFANITTNGGTTAFSVKADSATITVTPVNDAPLLFNALNPVVPTVNKSAINNLGFKVSNMIASVSPSEYITDVDGGVEGIAIYAVQDIGGHWEYSLDNTATWTSIGAVAANNALLLKSDASTYLRFVPNNTTTGDRKIFFRAWDQSTGVAGTKVDVSVNGGTTPFSVGADSVTLTVNTVNDAPVLNPAGSPTLPTIPKTNNNPAGISILSLIASGGANYITDLESTDPQGIAIYGAPSSGGTWEYSLNSGTTWTAVGTVDQSNSLLLKALATTKIRFRPNGSFTGVRSISFAAWDQSTGTEGTKVDTSTRGGTTAFSSARDTASITIT
ncbi:MAG: FG-GAP-like repeat-containing protein [Planctomycetales bacterium]